MQVYVHVAPDEWVFNWDFILKLVQLLLKHLSSESILKFEIVNLALFRPVDSQARTIRVPGQCL